jgi:hypothetical protein
MLRVRMGGVEFVQPVQCLVEALICSNVAVLQVEGYVVRDWRWKRVELSIGQSNSICTPTKKVSTD